MSKTIHDLEEALNSRVPNKQELILSVINTEGFDAMGTDRYGKTPLHLVASRKNTEAIRVLVEKGADMEAVDNYSRTPLYFAASSIDGGSEVVESVRALLELGADSGISLRGIMPGGHFAIINAAQAIDKILAESYLSNDDKCDIQVGLCQEDVVAITKRTKTIFEKKHGDLTGYPSFVKSILGAVESFYLRYGYEDAAVRSKLCPIGKALHEEIEEESPAAFASSCAASVPTEVAESDPTDTEGGVAQSHLDHMPEGGVAQSHPDLPGESSAGHLHSAPSVLGGFALEGWVVPDAHYY